MGEGNPQDVVVNVHFVEGEFEHQSHCHIHF